MELDRPATIWMFGLFLTAYLVQPLLVDVIKYNGGADSRTFLFLLPHYLAMTLVGWTATGLPKKIWQYSWWKGLHVSSLDIINQLLKKAGLIFAGSAVYIVIDSSSIVWTALWSYWLLGRKLNVLQWLAILLISAGCGLRAIEMDLSVKSDETIGIIMILLAAILMGLTFVLNEKYMVDANPIPGPYLVGMMGTLCSAVLIVWSLVYTLPNFEQLVLQRIYRVNGNFQIIGTCFVLLFCLGYLHSSTLWRLMKSLGAVSAGVMKGLKVAGVFVLSHFFFCHLQASQCLRPITACSATLCVLGVILYSYATKSAKPRLELRSQEAQSSLSQVLEMENRAVDKTALLRQGGALSDSDLTPADKNADKAVSEGAESDRDASDRADIKAVGVGLGFEEA
eukprot:Platyproteum_vivax@DN4756_c0_g1_i1.p1